MRYRVMADIGDDKGKGIGKSVTALTHAHTNRLTAKESTNGKKRRTCYYCKSRFHTFCLNDKCKQQNICKHTHTRKWESEREHIKPQNKRRILVSELMRVCFLLLHILLYCVRTHACTYIWTEETKKTRYIVNENMKWIELVKSNKQSGDSIVRQAFDDGLPLNENLTKQLRRQSNTIDCNSNVVKLFSLSPSHSLFRAHKHTRVSTSFVS